MFGYHWQALYSFGDAARTMAAVQGAPRTDPVVVEDQKKQDLYTRADDMESRLNTASENGLFAHQPKPDDPKTITYDMILEQVKVAILKGLQDKLSPEEYWEGLEAVDKAQNLYDNAVERVGRWSRFNYVYAGPAAVFMVFTLGVVVWLALKPPAVFMGLPIFLQIPKKIILAGILGSILNGITSLWSNVNQRMYRKIWGTWFVLSPFMGALLGGAVYLAFYVGIISSSPTNTIANPSLAILVALLAGYNWKWAQQLLSNAASIFTVKSP